MIQAHHQRADACESLQMEENKEITNNNTETPVSDNKKVTIIGIRFRQRGKVYYFSPAGLPVQTGDDVIVETVRGMELGHVVYGQRKVAEESIVSPLKDILRIADKKDKEVFENNLRKEKEALAICVEKCEKHGLEMKVVDCEYTFDGNKLLFYFTADGRVDFRELVKDLAAIFRTRIELRQIGVRDETKLLGGIGICGRELCCATYLNGFMPVSVKMAKEQNLSLNPTKISGSCGRLMCCLKYEQDTYEYLNARLPRPGEKALTPEGEEGDVVEISVLKQKVKVAIKDTSSSDEDAKEIREYDADELKFKKFVRPSDDDEDEEIAEAFAEEGIPVEEAAEAAAGEQERNQKRSDHGKNRREGGRHHGDRTRGEKNRGDENRSDENRGDDENRSDDGNREEGKHHGGHNRNRDRRRNRNRNRNHGGGNSENAGGSDNK